MLLYDKVCPLLPYIYVASKQITNELEIEPDDTIEKMNFKKLLYCTLCSCNHNIDIKIALFHRFTGKNVYTINSRYIYMNLSISLIYNDFAVIAKSVACLCQL